MGRNEAAHKHRFEDCFTNPKGRHFKEFVWRLRMVELQRKKEPIPEEMLVDGMLPPHRRPDAQVGTGVSAKLA